MDDYAYALGRLSMAWSALDHDLQETFQWLVGTDEETAAIITTGLERVEARAAPIKKLVVSQGIQPELADFIGALMNRITNEIGPERNRLIHDRWWLAQGGMERVDRRAAIKKAQSHQPASLQFNTSKLVQVSEINLLREYTHTVQEALWHLNIHLGLWRTHGVRPRLETRWTPACKPKTRLTRHQGIREDYSEWPQSDDFHTD
ncbi:MAG: hypothetical protein KAF27_00990 [Porphyrobacter sp.]|nr:hypothetical protein [Porphyrobacter sp.]